MDERGRGDSRRRTQADGYHRRQVGGDQPLREPANPGPVHQKRQGQGSQRQEWNEQFDQGKFPGPGCHHRTAQRGELHPDKGEGHRHQGHKQG